MTEAMISVADLSKVFHVWPQPLDMLREVITGQVRHQEFQALSDITFEVGKGEIVGLMGRNGAGKSTLLRIIAGTLDPTHGHVSVRGRLSAILELGTGFHSEYSGRENIKLGGMCLGLSEAEIAAKQEDIIAFSELADYIDRPFKTYSSGMQARLTFAVATCVDPDILIIDEALAVGDAKFQLKSFERVREFKRRGKTILLVSHDAGAIISICDRAILADKGRIVTQGDPSWVASVYHNLLFGTVTEQDLSPPSPDRVRSHRATAPVSAVAPVVPADASEVNSEAPVLNAPDLVWPTADVFPPLERGETSDKSGAHGEHRYGDRRCSITGVCILDHVGRGPIRELQTGGTYHLVMDCEAHEGAAQLHCGFLIRDVRGDVLFGSDTTLGQPRFPGRLENLRAGERRRVVAAIRNWLAPGNYFVSGAATFEVGKQSDMWFDAYEFRVVGPAKQHTNSRAYLDPQFSIFPLAVAPSSSEGG